MNFIKQLRNGLLQIEIYLAAASLFLLITLALAQILARNLFDTGIANTDILTRYLVLYVTFFGAAVAVQRDRHIKIDIGCALLPAPLLARLYRPTQTIAAIVCAFLTDAAIRFWIDEWRYAMEHDRWQVLIGLVIPLGFVLLTAQFVLAALLGQERE